MTFRYKAFISYSHADKKWGDWLHKAIETYRVPKSVVGSEGRDGPVPKKLFPVFRDREELPTSDDLGAMLRGALEDSAYLIVICSPRSAKSLWVNEEILTFKRMGKENRILALIVEGEPNGADKPGYEAQECFPNALKYKIGKDGELTKTPTEPIAADARKDKDGKRRALLKLLAGLLGVKFDALAQREKVRQRNRRIMQTAAALVLLASASIAFRFNQQADDDRLIEQSRALATQAEQALEEGDAPRALKLALAAVPGDDAGGQRPQVGEAYAVLHNALTANRLIARFDTEGRYIRKIIAHPNSNILAVSTSDDLRLVNLDTMQTKAVLATEGQDEAWFLNENTIATQHEHPENGTLTLWDANTGERLATYALGGTQASLTRMENFPPHLAVTVGYIDEVDYSLVVLDAETGGILWQRTVTGYPLEIRFGLDNQFAVLTTRELAAYQIGLDVPLFRESRPGEEDFTRIGFDMAPNASLLALVKESAIDFINLDTNEVRQITAPEGTARVFFTPDGEWVYAKVDSGSFFADHALLRVSDGLKADVSPSGDLISGKDPLSQPGQSLVFKGTSMRALHPLETRRYIRTLSFDEEVTHVAFLSDNRIAVAEGGTDISVWSWPDPVIRASEHGNMPVQFSLPDPEGQNILEVMIEGQFRIVDAVTGAVRGEGSVPAPVYDSDWYWLPGGSGFVAMAQPENVLGPREIYFFRSDGALIAGPEAMQSIDIRDIGMSRTGHILIPTPDLGVVLLGLDGTRRELDYYRGAEEDYYGNTAVALSADGQTAYIGAAQNGHIYAINTENGEVLHDIPLLDDYEGFNSLLTLPDGRLAYSSWNQNAAVLNLETGEVIVLEEATESGTLGLADESLLLVSGFSSSDIFDLETLQPLARLGDLAYGTILLARPQGGGFLYAEDSGNVVFLRPDFSKVTLACGDSGAEMIALDKSGSLAAASDGSTVCTYDLQTGRKILNLEHDFGVISALHFKEADNELIVHYLDRMSEPAPLGEDGQYFPASATANIRLIRDRRLLTETAIREAQFLPDIVIPMPEEGGGDE